MRYKVVLSENFKKEAKRLSKKHPSLKNNLSTLFRELEFNPKSGTHLGNNIYKIRLAITSQNKGKSGGARVLSYVKVSKTTVLLFSIYSKSKTSTLSEKQITELIKKHLG